MASAALFVQPHFDDIALSCGGTAALAAAAGPARAVTVFSAPPAAEAELSDFARWIENAWSSEATDSAGRWAMREREDDAAARHLGLTTCRMGYRDAIYRHAAYTTMAALKGPIDERDAPLIADLGARLVAVWRDHGCPPVTLPLAVGGHVDHAICFRAAIAGLRPAGAELHFYEDLPYALAPGAVDARLAAIGEPMTAREVDVTGVFPARLAAIAAYASQLAGLFSRGETAEQSITRHARAPGRGERFVERLWTFASAS